MSRYLNVRANREGPHLSLTMRCKFCRATRFWLGKAKGLRCVNCSAVRGMSAVGIRRMPYKEDTRRALETAELNELFARTRRARVERHAVPATAGAAHGTTPAQQTPSPPAQPTPRKRGLLQRLFGKKGK